MHRTAVGTTVYMSPERLRGLPYGRTSDLWSLGLVVLQLLTNLPPPWSHVKSMVDLLVTIEDCDPGTDFTPPECTDEAAEVVEACLQHDPGKKSMRKKKTKYFSVLKCDSSCLTPPYYLFFSQTYSCIIACEFALVCSPRS